MHKNHTQQTNVAIKRRSRLHSNACSL